MDAGPERWEFSMNDFPRGGEGVATETPEFEAEAALRAGINTLPEYPGGEGRRVSLFHYAPAFVLLVIVVAAGAQFADPDLWGHINCGQAILEQGRVVLHDTYSYSAFGH